MVVELVVPRTRTVSPVVIALAEAGPVPSWYVVDDASLTVTLCPVAVETVKPDPDTLSTTPTVPPAAGPDRAFDPPPAGPGAKDAAASAPGPDWMAYAAEATPTTMATTAMEPTSFRESIGILRSR
jgi:hypothetical protein